MDTRPPQRESPVVLAILCTLFLSICAVLVAIGYIFVTRSDEIAGGLETSVARPLVQARQTMTAAPRRITPLRRSTIYPLPPTLVPTPIAPVGWQMVLDEHFENDRAGWQVQDPAPEHAVLEIADGTYNWNVNGSDTASALVAVPAMSDPGDFFCTVDVADAPHAGVGFVFGYRDENNYARFVVSRSGAYHAEYQADGAWLPLFKGITVNAQAVPPRRIAMKQRSGTLEFWLNDVTVVSRPGPGIPRGRVGLTLLTARGQTVEQSFDNFQVQTP